VVDGGGRVRVESRAAGRVGEQGPQSVAQGARGGEFGRPDRVEVALRRRDGEALRYTQEPLAEVGRRSEAVELGSALLETRVREFEGQRLAEEWGSVFGDVLTVPRSCNRENWSVASNA
jgi:hypothetical protein